MIIGKGIERNEDIVIDLSNLVSTRLLIQANSGGGKSWLLRKILEESNQHIQQIVIDLEGEFSTLREKYDYLLVGKEGDIPINIRTAELLARKLLEINVSTIIDVSEFKKHERILFVKRFLDSLVDAPKKLWHPCLVVVDEAHQFCPQSTKSDSASSVIDLMTRGRKRGFCGILATQRISKLHKDACAEANNRLIGRTGLDVDRKRAGEELGFTSKVDERSLRDLEAGEFYAFGSSISKTITKIKVGNVKTTHPEPGIVIGSSPPPQNIKKILKEVINLPKEADEELKTKDDLKRKIKELKIENRKLMLSKPKPEISKEQVELIQNKAREQGYYQGKKESAEELKQFEKFNKAQSLAMEKVSKLLSSFSDITIPEIKNISKPMLTQKEYLPKSRPSLPQQENSFSGSVSLRAGAMKMLGWLACFHPSPLTKQKIATLSGFSVKGGTFNTYISELKRNGWVEGSNELDITEEGLKNVKEIPEMPTDPQELIEMWGSKFRAGARNILRYVCEKYPNPVSKEDIGYSTGFEPSGGTFNTYLSELRRNNLIKIEGGEISASADFFE